LLAVRRATSNRGKRTPGVDGVVWLTDGRKMRAVETLRRRGYSPLPLRRIYIKKKNGKLRPLGIPTMRDRAMQALYRLALVPIAETCADPNSYGFREKRACADAIGQCFISLSKSYSAQWVLEADIKGCFDNISKEWMVKQIPLDKRVLRAWLDAGYIDGGVFHPTTAGTPQGGIISPVLANMVLDGLERVCTQVVPKRSKGVSSKINVIRYADDFVVTAGSKELLEQKVAPAVRDFLAVRGLQLSAEKTKVTHVEDGIDFLGQRLRKYGKRLRVRPTDASIRAILGKTKEVIKACGDRSTCSLIKKLNPIIRGWANYHRYIYTARTRAYVDHRIHRQIWRFLQKRHPDKTAGWTRSTHFRSARNSNWVFHAKEKTPDGKIRFVDLFHARWSKTIPYQKIRAEANPYDKKWAAYLETRKSKKHLSLQRVQSGPPMPKRPCRKSNSRVVQQTGTAH
jgi:RNA-directed DNA polymerase